MVFGPDFLFGRIYLYHIIEEGGRFIWYIVRSCSTMERKFFCAEEKRMFIYPIEHSVNFMYMVAFVDRFLKLVVLMNPSLNCRQQAHLKPLLTRALDQLLWQRSLNTQVMRGLVALACPNQDTALLFGYLVEIIASLIRNNPAESETNTDVEAAALSASLISQEKANVAQHLDQHYCLDQVYLAAMPSPVRKAVLIALLGGAEVQLLGSRFLIASSPRTQDPAPICCITLEPLLRPDGTIKPDVVAAVHRSELFSKQHAFLYRGRALFKWLSSSAVPKSPETRTLVLPTDLYRLS